MHSAHSSKIERLRQSNKDLNLENLALLQRLDNIYGEIPKYESAEESAALEEAREDAQTPEDPAQKKYRTDAEKAYGKQIADDIIAGLNKTPAPNVARDPGSEWKTNQFTQALKE